MTYHEALNFIHSLDKFGSRPGLDRVGMLFDKVPGVLEQKFVHIAGTNGKGSVSTMLSSILVSAGYRTGLFISPYITDFRERIQIGGEMISEQELTQAVEFFLPLLEELNGDGVIITEFEFLTVLAFYLFKQNACDIVVCEVGMGGLLDSTNLIPSPLCSVITRIDLDHTAILGDTLDLIAQQKCGIIKEGSQTVAAAQPDEAMAVIEATATAKRNPLYKAEAIPLADIEMTVSGTRFTYQGERMTLPLLGRHQLDNLRCVLAVCEVLGIATDAIRDGLRDVRHPARFELLCESPVVILDGAHNRNGLTAFTQSVREYFGAGGKTLIIGMLSDKDSAATALLSGLFTRIIATDVDNPRALPAEILGENLRAVCDNVEVIHSPQRAFDKALQYKDDVFICGSLYLASEIRPYILEKTE